MKEQHDHTSIGTQGCSDCYKTLSSDKDGMLMYKNMYVVSVSHPSQLYQGDRPNNARQRKKHLAYALEGKSLCNMTVQQGEEKLDWDSPMQYVHEPDKGAGETCRSCWNALPLGVKERK